MNGCSQDTDFFILNSLDLQISPTVLIFLMEFKITGNRIYPCFTFLKYNLMRSNETRYWKLDAKYGKWQWKNHLTLPSILFLEVLFYAGLLDEVLCSVFLLFYNFQKKIKNIKVSICSKLMKACVCVWWRKEE